MNQRVRFSFTPLSQLLLYQWNILNRSCLLKVDCYTLMSAISVIGLEELLKAMPSQTISSKTICPYDKFCHSNNMNVKYAEHEHNMTANTLERMSACQWAHTICCLLCIDAKDYTGRALGCLVHGLRGVLVQCWEKACSSQPGNIDRGLLKLSLKTFQKNMTLTTGLYFDVSLPAFPGYRKRLTLFDSFPFKPGNLKHVTVFLKSFQSRLSSLLLLYSQTKLQQISVRFCLFL